MEQVSRYILISWDPPAASNGILVNYIVQQGGVAIAAVDPSVLEYTVTDLLPFTEYTFSVVVCTAAGCAESPNITITTLEDGMSSFPLCTSGLHSDIGCHLCQSTHLPTCIKVNLCVVDASGRFEA